MQGESSYSIASSSVDVSDLLNNATTFIEADIESVVIQLEDYSGTSIDGNIAVSTGTTSLFNQNLSLSATPSDPIVISSNILSLISAGSVPIKITGTTTNPIEDNEFSIKLIFKVKATVE